jgi:single-stranded-DNA-specific exonuclease
MEKAEHNPELWKMMEKAVEFFRVNYLQRRADYQKKEGKDANKGASNETDSSNNVESLGIVHIYSHLDADGMSSASILALALRNENISYQITILKQLEEIYIPEIKVNLEENAQFIFFLDYGSGQTNLINKYLASNNYIILDHHEPLVDDTQTVIPVQGCYVNPYFAQVNGSNEISGAGMTYLFTLALNPNNRKLSYLAVVGAMGDVQNVGSEQSLIGENQAIVNDALSEKLILVETEPALARSKSLAYSLTYTLPFKISELNDIKNTMAFLNKIGIKIKTDLGDQRTLADLSDIEKKNLTSELMKLALNQGYAEQLSQLIVTNYLLKPYADYPSLYDVRDFAKMLNACGRLDKQAIGIATCITQKDIRIKKAMETTELYSKVLRDNITWLKEGNRIKSQRSFNFFYGENQIHENIIGVVCTSLMGGDNSEPNKPIIGYADSDENFFKVSGRCNKAALESGINLSTAMRETCNKLNIEEKGGGHPPAAGATVPKAKIDDFLLNLDTEIFKERTEHMQKKVSDAFGKPGK